MDLKSSGEIFSCKIIDLCSSFEFLATKQIYFFNIYINNLLLSVQETELCNYADDTTIHTCDMHLKNVMSRLENDSPIIFVWFTNNYMKLNDDECHFMAFSAKLIKRSA